MSEIGPWFQGILHNALNIPQVPILLFLALFFDLHWRFTKFFRTGIAVTALLFSKKTKDLMCCQ